MTGSGTLESSLRSALARRAPLIAECAALETDCYRLFHGTQEGAPGLTLDRYGSVALIQTFHQNLPEGAADTIARLLEDALPGLTVWYNDRSSAGSRVSNDLADAQQTAAEAEIVIMEHGVRFLFRARHRGSDPWLFLDLRPSRRAIAAEASGKSLLNLFAYTCGVGVVAAVAGATRVVNVDFSQSGLAVGSANAALNDVGERCAELESDVFPAVRQFAGIRQPQAERGRGLPVFPQVKREQFDLVFLDPPARSKSRFGVVDLARDYQSVLKPSLGAVAPGGALYCTNNVAHADEKEWHALLHRCADKCGRPIRSLDVLRPGADFPSNDDRPPLKVARLGL